MAEQLICNQQVDGSTPFTSSIFYGGIPERPKGADCKSVVTDFAGPNPASPTIKKHRLYVGVFLCCGSLAIRNRHLLRKCAVPHTTKWYLAWRGELTRNQYDKCNYHIFYPERQYPASSPSPCDSVFFYAEEAVPDQVLALQARWFAFERKPSISLFISC